MTSIPSQVTASKAQQQPSNQGNQSSISNSDQQASSQQRSFSHSSGGSGAAGSRSQANPRNIQSNKPRHKNHRKPSMQRDDVIAEAVAMTSSTTSRKGKTSITHLMDWSTPPPRIHHQQNYFAARNHGRKNPTWGMGSGYHAIDKARYVNANYRFIVDPDGDYRAQSLDPDSHLQWTSILQVLASSVTQASSCPICLCDPVAPRMAKCGHIFCFPCLIRYMASVDEPPKNALPQQYFHPIHANKSKWKKCPICYDSVYMNEVRPVKFYTGQEQAPPSEGSDVMLRLMMRAPGSTLALPKDVATIVFGTGTSGKKAGQTEKESIPWHYAVEVVDYARIMKGTGNYMTSEYEREVHELEEQERVDELMFGDETDWVKKAIFKIRSSIEKVKEIPNKPQESHEKVLGREIYEKHLLGQEAQKNQQPPREPLAENTTVEVPDMYLVTSSHNTGDYPISSLGTKKSETNDNNIKTKQSNPPAPQTFNPPRSPTFQRTPHRTNTNTGHDPTQPYYFYQSLPHSYLSPLDIRILKEAFTSFVNFPSTILPRVENFSTGHVVDDDLRKRAKYLSHLPYGCEVAFLECDWTDIVPADVLEKFATELERRRKRKREKDTREERDRVRAEREEDEKRWSAARRKRGGDDDMSVARELSLRDFQGDYISGSSLDASNTDEHHDEGLGFGAGNSGPRLGFSSLPQSSPPNSSRTVWGTPAILNAGVEIQPVAVEEKKAPENGWLEDWERDVIAMDTADSKAGSKGKKKFKKVMLMSNTGKRAA